MEKDELTIQNARWLAQRLHKEHGSWRAAAAQVDIDQAALFRLARGRTASVTAALRRQLAKAAGEEPGGASSVSLESLPR